MNILIYGAGVIGSYLASELVNAGHEISMLARGKRYEELSKGELVIRHYLQRKTTASKVKAINSFDENDFYDAVFVVVQQIQVESVLPDIIRNTKCRLYILIGNNGTAPETVQKINAVSTVKPMVLFGFLGAGGRRENGKVISIHKKTPSLFLGDVTKNYQYKDLLSHMFLNCNINLRFSDEMDSWLKCHLAFILPAAYACFYCDGNLRNIAWNKKMLNKIIDAVGEGYQVLEDLGYPIEPKEDKEFIQNHRNKFYLFLKLCTLTPMGKLAASDHCMNAKEEMYYLDEVFTNLIKNADVDTPNWKILQSYMREYRRSHK